MFSSYKNAYILALILSLFYFVPFLLQGWSTDVWVRFMRIQEWAEAGFPLKETLMMSQNYPFGHEMHWTRPLDWIGYAFAWPFILNWGLHRALEIMSFYVPPIIFLIGVAGFFYALRGYLSPKAAFLAFALFFWSRGYVWGQSVVGYYDHHVFHFALLMWTLALVARYFLKPQALSLMIGAGILTALGTWITAEFFINLYIVSIPFILYWLVYNRSLKPLIFYTAAYTLTLLMAMTFDHPIAGFWTLDFYRVSLFHVLLGLFNLIVLFILIGFFRLVRTSLLRRFIYGALAGISLLCFLCFAFSDIFIRPLVDPFIRHFWIVHVQEMQPLYNTPGVVPWVILPLMMVLGFCVYAALHFKDRRTAFVVLLIPGLLFYAGMVAFHIRVGVSLNTFLVLLSALFFKLVFFPREKGFKITLLFMMYYLCWLLFLMRGDMMLKRIQTGVFDYYYNQYEKNQSVYVPKELEKNVLKRFKIQQDREKLIRYGEAASHPVKAIKNEEKLLSQQNPKTCMISKEAIEFLKEDSSKGGVMMELFRAPEILWKTGRPVFGGPYHGIIDGHKDLFFAFFDRPTFKQAYDIVQKRQVKHIYLQHPKCYGYMFAHPDSQEEYPNLETTFYYTLYNQSKDVPDWVKLVFDNPNSGEKIFQVIELKKKTKRKK